MTSNRDRAEWPDLFGEPLLASAALDRLPHGAHFVEITGQSFRAEHTKKQLTRRVHVAGRCCSTSSSAALQATMPATFSVPARRRSWSVERSVCLIAEIVIGL